jgi:hypothetical protein
MNELESDSVNIEIAEIERLIREFKEKFVTGTSDADNFINITQIELMWSDLQNRTNNIYSDILHKLMSEVDESELIRKKKRNTDSRESYSKPRQENQ